MQLANSSTRIEQCGVVGEPGQSLCQRPSDYLPAGVGPAPLGSGTLGNAGAGTGTTLQNAFVVGNASHGVAEHDFRLGVYGQMDARWQYAFRLDGLYVANNRSYLTTTSPAFCFAAPSTVPGINCSAQDYPNTLSMRLNFANVRWNSPGGFYVQIGRIVQDSGLYDSQSSMFSGGYSNGVRLGYITKRLNAWAITALGNSALTNAVAVTCPANFTKCANQTSNALQLKADYFFPSTRTDVGAKYDDWNGLANTSWNPSALLCVNSVTNPTSGSALVAIAGATCPTGTVALRTVSGAYMTAAAHIPTASAFFVQFFGHRSRPQFKVQFEGYKRFSVDPYTGSVWNGNQALYADIAFASKGNLRAGPLFTGTGLRNSNVVDFQFYNAGLNSYALDTAPTGVTAYTNEFYNSINGMQVFSLAFSHWFNNNMRAGLTYEHFGNKRGVFIPAGSPTCPGCYISGVNANTLFFDTYWIL